MAKLSFILILSFLFLQCRPNQTKTKYKKSYIFKEPIKIIVDSFIVENKGYNIYELYINKKSPHYSILYLFAGEFSRTIVEDSLEDQHPLIKIMSNKTPVYVYSGAERYIKSDDSPLINDTINKPRIPKVPGGVYWIIKDSLHNINIIKRNHSSDYPFMPLFRVVKFPPPIMADSVR